MPPEAGDGWPPGLNQEAVAPDEEFIYEFTANPTGTRWYHSHAEPIATEREDGTTLWDVAAGAGEGQARGFRMLPDVIEISVGATIRWTNHSPGEPHTVTFLGGDEPPRDILVEPQTDGPPTFICVLHGKPDGTGMAAKVIVTEGS